MKSEKEKNGRRQFKNGKVRVRWGENEYVQIIVKER